MTARAMSATDTRPHLSPRELRAASEHVRTIAQPIGAIDDDDISGRETALHSHKIGIDGSQRDAAHRHSPAWANQENEIAGRAVLNCSNRNGGLCVQRIHKDFDVDELLREQMTVAV